MNNKKTYIPLIVIAFIILFVMIWTFYSRPRIVIEGASRTRTCISSMMISNKSVKPLNKHLNSIDFLHSLKKECIEFEDLIKSWNLQNVTFTVDNYSKPTNVVFAFPTYSTLHGTMSLSDGFTMHHGTSQEAEIINDLISNIIEKQILLAIENNTNNK